MIDLKYENRLLRQRVIQLEDQIEEINKIAERSTDLLMEGDALRNSLMLKAIMAGAFSIPTQ